MNVVVQLAEQFDVHPNQTWKAQLDELPLFSIREVAWAAQPAVDVSRAFPSSTIRAKSP